jgi:cytochrome P450
MTSTFDPFDPEQPRGNWALLEELRRAGPVAPIAGGMHYLTRHAECRAALRDSSTFSNAAGLKMPGIEIPPDERILGELDPPRHTFVRRVMVTALTPKVVHAAESFMRETADMLLDALPVRGVADLVAGFTVPLPNRVTVHLLGFPAEDAVQIAAWAKELMESDFPRTNRTDRGEGFAAAFPEFAGYIDDQIAQRASTPGDDVTTRLRELEVEGERLPPTQVRGLVRNLITGGLTTTSQLLGNLLHQILTVPGLEDAVRSDAGALDTAIEESLRLAPPILFVARGCVRDTEIADQPVHTGERVIVGTASANRDERVFDDPDTFRADRPNADQHLTFGYGPHVCPGASLARVEARIGITAFLHRFGRARVRLPDGFELENVPTFFEVGPRRLPVEIRA